MESHCALTSLLGNTTHPAMPIRHFGKGHSQDLFDLLLCPAFTSQISQVAAGPEDQKPERRREGLPVKSHSNEQPLSLLTWAIDATQHPQLCVKVRAASHTTGTRHSKFSKATLPFTQVHSSNQFPGVGLGFLLFPLWQGCACRVGGDDHLPALLILDTCRGHPSYHYTPPTPTPNFPFIWGSDLL